MIATGGSNIFIAAALRSGSTHLALSLIRLLGMRMGRTNGLHGEGEEEHLVNPFSAALLMPYGGFVFQQHTKATSMNYTYLRNFNNKIIVMTRNLEDSLISLREWIVNPESVTIPGIVIPAGFKEWKEKNQYDWLIDNAAPWYLQFVYSWLGKEVLWVDYDEYYSDQVKGIQRICQAFGIHQYDPEVLRKVVSDKSQLSGRDRSKRPFVDWDRLHDMFDNWYPYGDALREKLI